jgi:KGK domain
MHDRFESLESGEVISVHHDIQVLNGHRTFRVGELSTAIESHLKKAIDNWNEENNGWFTPQGTECEALRFGSKGWQKGRIRLCLEFCPDEPNPPAAAIGTSLPTPVNSTPDLIGQTISPPSVPHNVTTANTSDIRNASPVEAEAVASHTPTPSVNTAEISSVMPMAGMAAVGTVAAVAAIATPNLQENLGAMSPHHVETTLEPEEHHLDLNTAHGVSLEEIAFDFDAIDKDRGIMNPNGMMELDLTDLGLDFAEQDLLGFETNGMSDVSEEFFNLHDLGKSENSGMLIDEVWNEMHQGNWPGIN